MKPTAIAQGIAAQHGRQQPVITVHFLTYLQSGGQMRYATAQGIAK